jgi:pyridinium-3,5-bisthiocarboxylic acid mononucleotide nickel chelatase
MIENSDLSSPAKQRALGIFQRIAEAEGKIHGVSPKDVHFHEVGALDSIADIVMTCVGIEVLGVERVFASALYEGYGSVQCAHGTFPVPAPATLEILRGVPLGQIDEPHELITPTGAAILAEFAESFGQMPTLKIERIGYGIGSRDLATRPNVLRAVIGELQMG